MAYQVSANSGYVEWDHLALFDGATQFSLSLWVKPVGVADNAYGRWVHQLTGTQGWAVVANNTDARAVGAVVRPAAVQLYMQALAATTWQHVFVAYNGALVAGERCRIWVGGSTEMTVASGGPLATSILTTTAKLRCGSDTTTNNASLNALAEVAIWTVAIDNATLRANLAAGRTPSSQGSSNLAFYAPMRDDPTAVIAPVGFATTVTVYNATVVTHPSVDVYVPGDPVPTLSVRVQESQVGGATF